MTSKKHNTENDFSKTKSIGYFQLFRYATSAELLLILIGLFFSCANAFSMPLTIIIYGEFTSLLVDRSYRFGVSSNTSLLNLFGGGNVLINDTVERNNEEMLNDSAAFAILLSIVSVLQFIAAWFSVDLFNQTALKQITRIRIKFLSSVLRQDIAWHDANSQENFSSRITEDVEKIREGMGEKVAMSITLICSFIICVGISFSYGWKLTLVCIACVPVLLTTGMLSAKFQSQYTTKELQSYSNAGAVAEEVLLSIRTVAAFGGEKKECERYNEKLKPAETAGRKKGLCTGLGEAAVRFVFFASNALAFWYGVTLILDDRDKDEKEYTPAVLMIAFFGVLMGSDSLARLAPILETFAVARGAAGTIFNMIERIPDIDSMSTDGKIINYGIKGMVEFFNVNFQYPSRIDVPVLQNMNFKVETGQTVALVGSSGNGKSTCLQLLQRFYDTTSGSIYIDGNEIKKLNINWLRSNIATVGQEPVLFATTIGENIRYGKPNATQKEIEDAAKHSNAHGFISKLPRGYDTLVGERGAQLSGGQKQRIAIARALIQDPKILLLDEATSALDSESQYLVQSALDIICKGRTTIIVSHRLSTIRKADRILYLDKGKIIEEGTHDELMLKKDYYYNLVLADSQANENMFEQIIENEMDKKEDELVAIPKDFTDVLHVQFKKPDADDNSDENDSFSYNILFKKIIKIARPEIPFLIIAFISSILAGASYPAFAVLLGDIYGALSIPDPAGVISSTNMICLSFIIVGIITAVSVFLQSYMFNLSGVYITTRIRAKLFASMVKQEVGWFDMESNSVGALCTKLSIDGASVQGAIGYPIGGLFQAFSTLLVGVSVAFYYSWKLALVCLSFIPFVIGSILVEARFMANSGMVEKTNLEKATTIATEAFGNLRTVASLRQESHMIARYTLSIQEVEKCIKKKMTYRGLVYSIGLTIPWFAYVVTLYYGGVLVATEGVQYEYIIIVSEALIFGAMMLGQSLAYAPQITAAFVAANRLMKVMDRVSTIVSKDVNGNRPDEKNDHTVTYSGVDFAYPTRPDVPILQGLDMTILAGKTVALVGHSGCGKSTCIQLLQRLYDADKGKICVDVNDIANDLAIQDLRGELGLVSQEPVLFDRTIAENIAYGDNTKNVHLADIIDAARMANIHEFIMKMPLSYDTRLGAKGTQLSGGQKQRIAIARALVRNPRILLLDEATSALDSQSEKIVQTALDVARSGRTCIIIAHRLSTIQNADVICVLQNGKVVEQDTHENLMIKGGIYWKLNRVQANRE